MQAFHRLWIKRYKPDNTAGGQSIPEHSMAKSEEEKQNIAVPLSSLESHRRRHHRSSQKKRQEKTVTLPNKSMGNVKKMTATKEREKKYMNLLSMQWRGEQNRR